MTADVRQLVQLAHGINAARVRGQLALNAVVTRGAMNVKRDWRANAAASAGRHARLYPSSISYDLTPIPGGMMAEIGPDKARPQGALGNLLEYGSANNPPHNDGGRALASEAARFAAAVAAVASGVRL
ncbi:hypothetical protein [Streptomyces harbinensis]|uniref:hypothetical protein n=1 Tax=Streptomyces harbinensis TaxID=1176198 RepID=UPI00368F137F